MNNSIQLFQVENKTKRGLYIDCGGCGKKFYAPKWWLEKGAKYCSYKCYWRSKLNSKPWNIGTKGVMKPNSGSFISSVTSFKGTLKEYKKLHYLVRKNFGSPHSCRNCGVGGRIEWANSNGRYNLDRSNWLPLCHKCHYVYDNVENRRARNVR